MKLEGSCHCGAARFSVESETPVPFMLCYCSICRKTGGGGGYAINIMGLLGSLRVTGAGAIRTYRARREEQESELRRKFCGTCGSGLWAEDPRWPEWCWPFASAIDTPLPRAGELVHLMEQYRPQWVVAPQLAAERHFPEYPEESIQAWHEQRGLLQKG